MVTVVTQSFRVENTTFPCLIVECYLTLTLPSCTLKTSWLSSVLLVTNVMLQLYSHYLVVCLCSQLPCKLQLVMSGMLGMTGHTASSVSGTLLSFSRVLLRWSTWWESWLYLLQMKQNSLENWKIGRLKVLYVLHIIMQLMIGIILVLVHF